MTPAQLIRKWSASGAAESANAQSFTNDLCELLGVDKPDPMTPVEADNRYVFEKPVRGRNGNLKFIDCYKRGHFVLENKQGAAAGAGEVKGAMSATRQAQLRARKTGHGKRGSKTWDTAMEKARRQGENYARLLSGKEIAGGRPPFLMVADVGYSIAVYADWSGHAAHYQPFPDPNNYRIQLADLEDLDIQKRLYQIWTEPQALNPARNSARVTKEIADYLARLAKSLEGKHDTETVAGFLMRCLFTMFAEDVGLLEDDAFTVLLQDATRAPDQFEPMVRDLWEKMNTGGFSLAIRQQIRHFNGGLFSPPSGAGALTLPLDQDQIQLLVDAARADWREVEPAIFGTLLERALNPRERHKLGAHYTPRAYVERLVQPTILEPLRKEWDGVQAAALLLEERGDNAKAVAEVEGFLQRLADLRVLDPACGSANFLYVTLELLKRLEGEVQNVLRGLGQQQISIGLTGATITPENMLGIELNPRAAKIAELVLWIGYLQWHLRSTGNLSDLGSPILRDYHNIENRDAVLEWDRIEDVLDENGEPVTRWDGVTYKTHPVTGEPVPDDAARTQVQKIVGGRKAEWPKADFIVGNPPFIGTSRMRETLGDGYTEAVRKAYKNVPASADFVMFWWDKAAELVRNGKTERFGFITTNSIRQTFNRRVIQHHMNQKKPLSLAFAIPDHPWVDSADAAAVDIAMTVGIPGENLDGEIQLVTSTSSNTNDEAIEVQLAMKQGVISPDLSVGANVTVATGLRANSNLASRGIQLYGAGFLIEQSEVDQIPGYQRDRIYKYLNGRDLTSISRNLYFIDLLGLTDVEAREKFPNLYQIIHDRVKPSRDQSNEQKVKENWWLPGRTREEFRQAITNQKFYIGTVETSKYRFFVQLNSDTIPDNMLIGIALSDNYFLGVLSSSVHIYWALAQGGLLGPTPRYNKTRCFETFPFPAVTEDQKQTIRALAERLEAHRKRQQSLHPKLTMTGMYNVLEKERAGEPLNDKERKIHQDGLVGILRELHDELDAAVAAAYGWPADLPEAEILQRLVDLNAERAAEEARGLVRWLRPEYQAPDEAPAAVQGKMDLGEAPVALVTEQRKWNAKMPLAEKTVLLRDLLAEAEGPLSLEAIAAAFKPRLRKNQLAEVESILSVLEALGQAPG